MSKEIVFKYIPKHKNQLKKKYSVRSKNHSSDTELKMLIFISRPFPHHMNSFLMNETLNTWPCQILSSCPTLQAQIVFFPIWKPSISWSRILFFPKGSVIVQLWCKSTWFIYSMLDPCPHQYIAYWFCFQRRFVGKPLAAWPRYWRHFPWAH